MRAVWIPPAHSPFTLAQAVGSLGADASSVAALERELCSRFGAARVVLTDSGTHALERALRLALTVVPDDRRRIAMPAYSCFDLVTALLAVPGAEPVFYDIDPATLAPDASSLQAAVSRGAGVVVAANLFGFPIDPRQLDDLRGAGVVVVEDAAQGLGARCDGREAGTLGDLTVLSFGRGKGWTGSGGGALLIRGPLADAHAPDGLERAGGSRLGLAARAVAQWALARPGLFGVPARMPWLGLGEAHFRAPTPARAIHPYQAELVRRSAALARREIELRRWKAERVDRVLEGLGGVDLPHPLGDGEAGWLRRPLLVENLPVELPRAVHRGGLYRAYPRPLPELWAEARGEAPPSEGHPGALRIVRSLITVPVHERTPLERLVHDLPELVSRLADT